MGRLTAVGRLTAAWSLLTECSTISYMVINSSHDLAVVSVESNLHKCHSAFWHLCGQFQWGQWMAILMSGQAAGMILESRMDDTTAAYYRVTWQCCQPHEIIQQFRSPIAIKLSLPVMLSHDKMFQALPLHPIFHLHMGEPWNRLEGISTELLYATIPFFPVLLSQHLIAK